MTTILLAILYIIIFLFICIFFSKREGYYSTVLIFGLSSYIYYIGIPVEMILGKLNVITKGDIKIELYADQLNKIVFMAIIALISFSVGYYISRFNPLRNNFTNLTSKKINYSIIFLWIISIMILGIFFYNIIPSLSTYSLVAATNYDNPLFSLLIFYIILISSLVVGINLKTKKLKNWLMAIILIVLIFSWGFYSSDKNILLIGLLGISSIFINSKINKKPIFIVFIILCIIFGIFSFKLFNIYRTEKDISSLKYFSMEYLRLRYSDPVGPFSSIENNIKNTDKFLYGATYKNILLLSVPKSIWKNRPLDLSEDFARKNIDNWTPGKGRGYSPLAEAYLNFGLFGSFIQYFLIGFFWGLLWKFFRKTFFWHFPTTLWQTLYSTLGYYILILSHRAPVSGFFKNILLYITLFIIFSFLFDLSMLKKHKILKQL